MYKIVEMEEARLLVYLIENPIRVISDWFSNLDFSLFNWKFPSFDWNYDLNWKSVGVSPGEEGIFFIVVVVLILIIIAMVTHK